MIASGVYTLDDWQEQVIQGQKGPGKAGQSLESRRGGSQGPRRKHNGSLLIIDADGPKEEALTKLRTCLDSSLAWCGAPSLYPAKGAVFEVR